MVVVVPMSVLMPSVRPVLTVRAGAAAGRPGVGLRERLLRPGGITQSPISGSHQIHPATSLAMHAWQPHAPALRAVQPPLRSRKKSH